MLETFSLRLFIFRDDFFLDIFWERCVISIGHQVDTMSLYFRISGFAANELASRINHAEPKVIIAASCGLEPSKVIKYVSLFFNKYRRN